MKQLNFKFNKTPSESNCNLIYLIIVLVGLHLSSCLSWLACFHLSKHLSFLINEHWSSATPATCLSRSRVFHFPNTSLSRKAVRCSSTDFPSRGSTPPTSMWRALAAALCFHRRKATPSWSTRWYLTAAACSLHLVNTLRRWLGMVRSCRCLVPHCARRSDRTHFDRVRRTR